MSTTTTRVRTPTRLAVDQAARLTALHSQHAHHITTPNPVLAIGVLEEILLLAQDMEEEGSKINGSVKDLVIAQNEYAVKLVQDLPTESILKTLKTQKTQKKADPDAAASQDAAIDGSTYYLHKALFLTSVETNLVVGDQALRLSLRGLTMNNLGFVFMADNKPKVALGWLTKVVRMESGNDAQSDIGGGASTHVNIATCLGQLGRNKEAMRHAKFAVKTLLLEQAEQSEQSEQQLSTRVEEDDVARKAVPYSVVQATTQQPVMPAIAQDDMFSPPAAKANTIGIFGRGLSDPMGDDLLSPIGSPPPVGRGIDMKGQTIRRPRQGCQEPAVDLAPHYFEQFGGNEVVVEAGHDSQAASISASQFSPRTRDRIANTNRGRLSLLASAYFNLAVLEEKSRKGEDALKHYEKALALAEGGVSDMFKRAEGECRKRVEAELGKRTPKKPEPVKPKKSPRAPAGVARVGRNIAAKKPDPVQPKSVKPKKSPRSPAEVARAGRNIVIEREVVVVEGVVNVGAEEVDSSITVSGKDPSKERHQSTDKSEKAAEDNGGGVVIGEMSPFASPTEALGNAVEAVAIAVEGVAKVALGEGQEATVVVAEVVKLEETVVENQGRAFGELLASPPTSIASPAGDGGTAIPVRGAQDRLGAGLDLASLTPVSPNERRMSAGVTIGEHIGGIEARQDFGGLGVSGGVTIGEDGLGGIVVGERTPSGARTPAVGKSPFDSTQPVSASANSRIRGVRTPPVGVTLFESPASSSNKRNKTREGKSLQELLDNP